MDDLDLIRHFRSSVEQPSPARTARARSALAAELDLTATRRRRTFRLRPALAAALIPVASAATAALAITGTFSSDGTSVADAAIIHRADAALTPPPNMILHVKVAGGGFVAESWQLTSAPYSVLEYKGPVGTVNTEDAQNGTSAAYWDPSSNTIHVTPGATPQAFDNPIAQVKDALHAGDARVIGSATREGLAVYAIQFKGSEGFNDGLTVYVDRTSYRPVLIDDPQRDGTVVHLRVLAVEYLPASSANRALLTLQHWHPSARVATDTRSAELTPTK